MQIDRRITNGLAWAGALLVVGIPAADFVTRQFQPAASMQVAIAEEQKGQEAPKPTPLSQRPAEKVAAKPAVETPAPKVAAPAAAKAEPVAKPASPAKTDDV